MKSVDPSIYDTRYYLSQCLGSDEFKKSRGNVLHPRVKKLFRLIPLSTRSIVLDAGCGRGDIALQLAKKAGKVYGIDYSKDAITIANSVKKHASKSIQKKLFFRQMNATKLLFPDNYFDVIVSIDVFEHLYKDELELAMNEIRRVLKKDGILFVDTNTNKWLYDFTYTYYIRPVNLVLTRMDMLMRRIHYDSMPRDPRIPAEKIQHVNEPTFFYLRTLFRKYDFYGKILTETGYLKNGNTVKSAVYNFLTTLHPLSQVFPLSLLFTWSFICVMKNKKVT